MQDKIKGEGNEIKGTVKEDIGKLSGNKHLENSGKYDQVKGEFQEKVGDAKMDHRKMPDNKP